MSGSAGVGRRAGPVACVALLSALLASGLLWDRDWGFHLATFERLVAERALPRQDAFSYASDWPYEPVHLLFQLALGAAFHACGTGGVALVRVLAAVAIGLALHGALRRRGLGPWAAAGLTLLVQAGGAYRLVERPHLATTLGLVLLLDALLAWRERGLERPARLVPLLLLWANTHPGAVYGVVTAWGFVLAEAARAGLGWRGAQPAMRVRALAVWVGLGTLATFLNPLGPGLYPYLLRQDGVRELGIRELKPVWEAGLVPLLGAGVLALGGLLLLRRAPRLLRRDPTLLGASLAFGLLGAFVSREVPLALVVLALTVAPEVARVVAAHRPLVRALTLGLVLAPALLGVVDQVQPARRLGRWPGGLDPWVYPETAADWLLEHRPRGPLYNTNAVGSYLLHRLWPHYQVYSDGRIPMFVTAMREERDFARVEARWDPQVLVVDFAHRELEWHPCEQTAGFAERWVLVHVSAAAKVYLRREGANAALAEQFGYRHLRYKGRWWTGRVSSRGGVPVPVHGDPAALATEVERARSLDPHAARWLPPPG